jgi:ribosomal protein L37AE/L43A
MRRRARTSPTQPDWEALADGRVHRLQSGRDYAGDARPHIRAARGAASDMGTHVIVSRDDLGNSSFLWVQFVAGVAGRDPICPGCDEETLTQRGPSIARCDSCGNAYALREQWAEDEDAAAAAAAAAAEEDYDEDGTGRAAPAISIPRPAEKVSLSGIVTHPALPPPRDKPAEQLRDVAFMTTLGRVLDARATRMDMVRLWTLWEAVGTAAPLCAANAEIGSTWAGGALFLALAGEARVAGGARTFVVDHPVYREYTRSIVGDDSKARAHLEAAGATVFDGDMSAVADGLAGREYGVVHVDLSEAEEITTALTFFDQHLRPGGVIVVEGYRIPSVADDSPGQVALGVDAFLANESSYVTWRTQGRQLILLRRS